MGTFGSSTFGSGLFGDPITVELLAEQAGSNDTALFVQTLRLGDTSTVTDTATVRLVRLRVEEASSSDTLAFSITRHAGTEQAGSSDEALRSILRVVLDEAAATDALALNVGQALVEAADSAGADDVATFLWQRWRTVVEQAGPDDTATSDWRRQRSYVEQAGARDVLNVNGVPAAVDVFTAWAGVALGSDRIVIRDAPLVVSPRYGNKERDWNAANAVIVDRCSVQPYGAAEVAADREFTSTHMRLFAPPNVELTTTSRVIFDGATYEVDGEPAKWRDLDGRPSHVEAALKRLAG